LIRDIVRKLAVFIRKLCREFLQNDSIHLTVSSQAKSHQHGIHETECKKQDWSIESETARDEEPCEYLKSRADAKPSGYGELVSDHLYISLALVTMEGHGFLGVLTNHRPGFPGVRACARGFLFTGGTRFVCVILVESLEAKKAPRDTTPEDSLGGEDKRMHNARKKPGVEECHKYMGRLQPNSTSPTRKKVAERCQCHSLTGLENEA
jgi:hypothetical protein